MPIFFVENTLRVKLKYTLFIFLFLFIQPSLSKAQNKKLTFKDIMKWERISKPVISSNGKWVAYNVWPDRGDGYVKIQNIDDGASDTIVLGKTPKFSRNSQWVAVYKEPKLKERLEAKKGKPKRGAIFRNVADNKTLEIDSVWKYKFSRNSQWAIAFIYKDKQRRKQAKKNTYIGNDIVLIHLSTGKKYRIANVQEAIFNRNSTYMIYSIVQKEGVENGLYYRNLEDKKLRQKNILSRKNTVYSNLRWNNRTKKLAFTETELTGDFWDKDAEIKIWNALNNTVETLVSPTDIDQAWALRDNNRLRWSSNGQRLFFRLMTRYMVNVNRKNRKKKDTTDINIYDIHQILDKKGLDVWHYKDKKIKPYAKKQWNKDRKQTYEAVYHFKNKKIVQLEDLQVPYRTLRRNAKYALGYTSVPYQFEHTWNRTLRDYYVINIETGQRTLITKAKGIRYRAKFSKKGRYVVFYKDKDWYLYNIEKDTYKNLTKDIQELFYNEKYSRPKTPPPFGVAGWIRNDKAVLLYGTYNIWEFSTADGTATNLTKNGKERNIRYRIAKGNKKIPTFKGDDELLIRGFHRKEKNNGFYSLKLNHPQIVKRLESKHKYTLISKVKRTGRILYTRESYDEYPNLWISDQVDFSNPQRITNMHLHLHQKYNWGKAELISWTNTLDGKESQGTLIKPDNFDKNKTYPVLIYYYGGTYAKRIYDFNRIRNDDRPTLPQYVSDGYVVFMPNIRFKVGMPGIAASKSVVSGVSKLIKMGIADKNKIGIHGHSWGGYQTAFNITQTNMFSAAVAGAPVSNMTSAYGGIRWGTGKSRQVQYERGQSRIGGTLWQYRKRYIKNSPLFFVDKVETPLLIMTGDEDSAVPWYQDIEMQMAMKRLGKKSIMLQYHGEPHHLKRYANRLDYAIKMKQFFDFYLRSQGNPKWILEGVPYLGK